MPILNPVLILPLQDPSFAVIYMYKPHPFGCHKGAPHLFPHFNLRLITNQNYFFKKETLPNLQNIHRDIYPNSNPINTLHWLIGLKCRHLNSTSTATTSLRTNFSLADRSKVSKFYPLIPPHIKFTFSPTLHILLSLLYHLPLFAFSHFHSTSTYNISINRSIHLHSTYFQLTPIPFHPFS